MTVNPEILKWARSTAGLTPEDAARALGFSDTRDRSATDRLNALEAGDEEPSRSVVLRMSKAYRRSLLVFYLAEPPSEGDRGKDFRTVPGGTPPLYDPVLDALIRDIRGRQSTVRAVLEETDPRPIEFIAAATLDEPTEDLARRITERLSFSLEDFRRQPSVEAAFTYLRETIEAAGIYVLLLGNLGSHHTNIPSDAFRGFAIADPIAPFIVINDQDSKAAWAFTALHELAHLWIGATGISGASIEARIERYCNEVAGEILLPAAELTHLAYLRRASFQHVMEVISNYAHMRKISRAMVAYRFLRTDVISENVWRQVADQLRQEWLETRRTQEENGAGESGGPSYYVVKRHRLGNALLGVVRRALGEGILTYTKAAQVLGVKPRNVDPLINGTLLQGSR